MKSLLNHKISNKNNKKK